MRPNGKRQRQGIGSAAYDMGYHHVTRNDGIVRGETVNA